jgi:hypothetical protein
MKKKKFISMATPVKQVLQYMLNCMVHECHSYYLENNKSFPADETSILSEIMNYAQTQCEEAVSPFIFEVADLYDNVSSILEDEPKKGTGVLRNWMETEFKKVFETGKAKKAISTQLIYIQNSFINFIKVLAIFLMDHFWENKTPLNIGKLLGTIRQLSRLVAKNGGECPPMFYEYAQMFVEQNSCKRAPGKGAGKKAPAKKKAAGKKATGKKANATDDTENLEDDDLDVETEGKSLDSALDAVDDEGDDFGEDWADDALPEDE